MSPSSEQSEALVLGAGPVGMFTALRLAAGGVRVRIVDMYRRTALHSYALALHPQTLRLLDEVALAQTLVDHGQRVDRVALYDDRRRRATLELGPVGGEFPFILVLPQAVLESALERRLADEGVTVEWGHQALMFDADADGVTAVVAEVHDPESRDVEASDVATRRLQAEFLIGADGYHSLTRRLLGVSLDAVGQVAVALMEFEAPIEDPGELRLVLARRHGGVLWPLGPERGRWSLELDRPDDCREAADAMRLVRERASWFGDDFGRVEWFTTVGFERRLARRFGRERIWLVGDAARFTSPLGVQSMNVGFREGHDLARRIVEILRRGGSPKLLQYYNEERQREWKMLLGLRDRLQRLENAPPWAAELGPSLVAALPASGHDLNVLLEQVGLRLYWLRRKRD